MFSLIEVGTCEPATAPDQTLYTTYRAVKSAAAADAFQSMHGWRDIDVPRRGSNGHSALKVGAPEYQGVTHDPRTQAPMPAGSPGERTGVTVSGDEVLARNAERVDRRAPRQGQQDIRVTLGVRLPNQPQREGSRNPSQLMPCFAYARRAPAGRDRSLSSGSKNHIDPVLCNTRFAANQMGRTTDNAD